MFRILAVRTKHNDELIVDAPLDRLAPLLAERGTRVWVDLGHPVGEAELAIVRDVFKFHPLAIEDCFEGARIPKIDEYDGYLYIITHGLTAGATADSSEIVELDAFLGENFLVTHHSAPSRSITTVLDFVQRTGLPLRQGVTAVLHASSIARPTDWKRRWTTSKPASRRSRTRCSPALVTRTSLRCCR